ncbi:MAG: dihydrodipicolinate synthase family protein [Chloroflexota bacterium]
MVDLLDPAALPFIAATFTPMHPDGRLNLDAVPAMVDRLIEDGITGLFVCGGTGEALSLTGAERMATAEAFMAAAAGRLPVIVHVGDNSLFAARDLAAHARAIGAAAISAMAPSYTRPQSIDDLISGLEVVAGGAPDLPFIYYHIPGKTGLTLSVASMLGALGDRLPSLVAVKFSDTEIHELTACLDAAGGRYRVFFGCDEMLLSGLVAGATGAIGSTYNFAGPLYLRVIDAYRAGDTDAARRLQAEAARMVRVVLAHGGLSAQKAVMALSGMDCGPTRLPNPRLPVGQIGALQTELAAMGFFDWARVPEP